MMNKNDDCIMSTIFTGYHIYILYIFHTYYVTLFSIILLSLYNFTFLFYNGVLLSNTDEFCTSRTSYIYHQPTN
jgi:hypothetical protein